MDDLKIKIAVKNLTGGFITYSSDLRHVRREWSREGQVLMIPAEELQEVIYDQGTYNLFAYGYLGIENSAQRELIGLEYEGTGPRMEPFDRKKAEDLLMNTELESFKEKLYDIKTKSGQIEVLVNTACDLKNVSYDKQKAIEEALGVNIQNLIRNSEE